MKFTDETPNTNFDVNYRINKPKLTSKNPGENTSMTTKVTEQDN